MSSLETARRVWGLVPAGGMGTRFGGDKPKQLVEVAGQPLLAWTFDRLLAAGVEGLTVALPAAWLSRAAALCQAHERVLWVAGGTTRQESVAACLAESPEDVEFVLVHDGARAAVAVADIRATIAAAEDADGAVLGRPVVDTLKQVEDGRILATVERESLWRAETPQVFRRAVLARALAQAQRDRFVGTDESSLVERLGGTRIRAANASHPNPKLTVRQDLGKIAGLLEGAEGT